MAFMYIKIRTQRTTKGGNGMARHSHPHCRRHRSSLRRAHTLYVCVPNLSYTQQSSQAIPGPGAVTGAREIVWYGLQIFCILFRHIHNILYVGCASDVMLTDYGVSLCCSDGLWRCGVMAGGTGGFYIMMAR